MVGGALMAIGGAFLTLAVLGSFTLDIVSGRGWVRIALVIFARWRVARRPRRADLRRDQCPAAAVGDHAGVRRRTRRADAGAAVPRRHRRPRHRGPHRALPRLVPQPTAVDDAHARLTPPRTETSMTDEEMLARAVAEARQGLSEGGIPIGAVLVRRGSSAEGTTAGSSRGARSGTARPTAWRTSVGCRQASTRSRRWSRPCRRATCAPARSCSTESPASWWGRTATSWAARRCSRRAGWRWSCSTTPGVEMMASFIAENPTLWNEDIGVEDEAMRPPASDHRRSVSGAA